MGKYAVGFARPDRWVQPAATDGARPWHAVEALRPAAELDGEVELAVCGAIVQVWGWQDWDRVSAGQTACEACQRLVAVARAPSVPRPSDGRRLRVVS